MIYIRLLFESIRFAVNALRVNPLRTILSLTGVTIGVFTIIAVLTVVDSLERSVKNSFSFLGAGVIYVEKWPFVGSPDFPWWKYLQRPEATYEEYKFLEKNATWHDGICIFAIKGNSTIKHENNSVGNKNLFGVTYGHSDIFELEFEDGRYFSRQEIEHANNVAIIGSKVAEGLFGDNNAVDQTIKIKGLKFRVIGVMKEEGESLLDTPSSDDNILIPFNSFRKLYYVGKYNGIGARIGLKGKESDEDLTNLEGEITGLMRIKRGLKPKEENNFELNRPEAIANAIGNVFKVLKIAGAIIGGISMLIGAVGIANIMFVSVKERTNIIGIQKSLGAKNYFILYQFLFESVVLSTIGGGVGIFLVYLITFLPTGTLELMLTPFNIIVGVGVSAIIGMLSGIIPASQGANMDPVIAIRTQ